MTPTQRTLKELRDKGLIVDIVERWIPNYGTPGGGFRKDLFSIIDIIVLDIPEKCVIGVQSTGSAFSEHIRKMTGEQAQNCIYWLSVPTNKLYLYAWRKVKLKRGGRAERWKPRIAIFSLTENKQLLWVEQDA